MKDKEELLPETTKEDKKSDAVNSSTIGESKDDDFYNYIPPNYYEDSNTKIKDIKGGRSQKILGVIFKVFGFNLLFFGIAGTVIGKVAGIDTMNPLMSCVISLIAMVIIQIVRKILYFINRHNEKDKA